MRRSHDFRDCIAPDCISFQKNHYELGDHVGRTLFLREYASFISDAMITELMDYPRNMMLSIDIIPVAMDEAVSDMAKFEYMQRAFSSELKPRARLVLQVLVLHCNKEGECFPSIKTIAAKCGYGVSTVKRALDELVKAGYIVKQARFDERKNGGQTSNLYTLCSDLLCPDEPENAPVLEDDASDESPAVQPESAPADACNASDPTPGEQSATLPTADSYSFADGFETKIGRQFCRPIRMWTGGQSIFIPP